MLVVPATAIALSHALPGPLVLPVLGGMSIAAGFVLALMAWMAEKSGRPTSEATRTVAAMLVFLGFAAAILTDAEAVLAAFADLDRAWAAPLGAGR